MGLIEFAKKVFEKKFVNQAIYGIGQNSPQWKSQNEEDYIEEAYNQIVWVYACVSKIADSVGGVKWCLYKNQFSGKKKEISNHPILGLVNKSASLNWSSKEFFTLWALNLALTGKNFVVFDNAFRPTSMKLTYPHLTWLYADQDEIIKIEHRNPQGYQEFLGNQIIFSKFSDPLNYFDGQSPIKAMARTIDTENSGIDWNKSTLDNLGIPPGAIMLSNPSPSAIEQVKNRWRKDYAGNKNARIPLVLDAEKASYVNFGMTSVEMDFILQRKLTRTEICAGFGVPSQVVGDPEGQTYANYGEALKSLWQDTIIPKYLRLIQDNLNMTLCSKYDSTLCLEPDLDDIAALAENQDDKATRVTASFEKNLITQNEGREALGYDSHPDGDRFNFELTPASASTPQDTQQAENISVPEENIPTLEDAQKKSQMMAYERKVTKIFSTDWRKEMLAKEEAKREKYIKSMQEEMSAFFKKQGSKMEKLTNYTEKACNKLIDKDSSLISKILVKNYEKVTYDFGTMTVKELIRTKAAGDYKFELTELELAYINNVAAEKITQINDTTKLKVKSIIELGAAEGWTIAAIGFEIQNSYGLFSESRAELIAQTEMIGMSNYGSHSGAKGFNNEYDAGLKKIWINTLDGKTRPSHVLAGAHKPINMDEKFQVGRAMLEFPGDQGGLAEEVCRCRCAIGYV
jgi:HK97 family phage portal protein